MKLIYGDKLSGKTSLAKEEIKNFGGKYYNAENRDLNDILYEVNILQPIENTKEEIYIDNIKEDIDIKSLLNHLSQYKGNYTLILEYLPSNVNFDTLIKCYKNNDENYTYSYVNIT